MLQEWVLKVVLVVIGVLITAGTLRIAA